MSGNKTVSTHDVENQAQRGNQSTVEAALAAIPSEYRFYSADASTVGTVRVLLELQGEANRDWHDMGEVLDATGKDIRPDLYRLGVAPTLAGAIWKAIEDHGR